MHQGPFHLLPCVGQFPVFLSSLLIGLCTNSLLQFTGTFLLLEPLHSYQSLDELKMFI